MVSEVDVPTGKVRFYDPEKGFGFISGDDGSDVHVRAAALPAGVAALRPGTRVEYSVVDGRRGPSVLTLSVIEPVPSMVAAHRKPTDDMTVIIEDLIKMLDGVSTGLRRGRYPEPDKAKQIASVLRGVAEQLES
jgi:CspA family cold shock protein